MVETMIAGLILGLLLLQTAAPAMSPEEAALVRSGIEAENRHDTDAAIASFRKATELAPSDPIAFGRLGQAYINKRDYAAAIAPLKRALELSPDSLPVHQLLGYALLAEGYAGEAIPHLELIHDYRALGVAQLQAGKISDAVTSLLTALASNPNDPDLLYYLSQAGSALSSQSRDKLLSDFGSTPRGHQTLGESYYQLKLYSEAAHEYQQALAQRPDLPGLRLELGQVYAANSEWAKAEEQFRLEAKLQPGSAEAAYRLGDTLLHEGKMQEAAAALRRSDELRPDMAETLLALGKAAAVGDPSTAEKALNRVIELEKSTPVAAQAYFTLAGIHRKQGKTELATRETEQFRRLQAQSSAGVAKQ